ncbi:hypothetical protein [Sphingorhabdus sp.]|uniref:hypothetical protein n=1 Tax=Sphingorhabdus sp. TaxID=1902408 RepID=UPI0035941D23
MQYKAMQLLALTILCISGFWLVAIGFLMAFRPAHCLHILSLTASTHRINLTEQGLRMIAGAAMIIRSGHSKIPLLFEVGGWFIVVSSLLLMLIPLRWHAGYAIWWATLLPIWAVRTVAPLSIAAGSALIYAAI